MNGFSKAFCVYLFAVVASAIISILLHGSAETMTLGILGTMSIWILGEVYEIKDKLK